MLAASSPLCLLSLCSLELLLGLFLGAPPVGRAQKTQGPTMGDEGRPSQKGGEAWRSWDEISHSALVFFLCCHLLPLQGAPRRLRNAPGELSCVGRAPRQRVSSVRRKMEGGTDGGQPKQRWGHGLSVGGSAWARLTRVEEDVLRRGHRGMLTVFK